MITLGGSGVEFTGIPADQQPRIARVSTDTRLPTGSRARQAFLMRPGQSTIPDGHLIYILLNEDRELRKTLPSRSAVAILPDEYAYLADGDIIRLVPARKAIRVLYRRASTHNSILLTERCNNYCLMCSQPPRERDDSWLVAEVLDTIPLIDRETRELGFTGGEPTLLGDDLISILNACKTWLPSTVIHVLSNGRRFADASYCTKYANVGHPDLMVGIPLYSDLSHIHDYVVQADGAFDETIRGILNLKRLGQRVELRVVIHKQTYERLPELAEFITRNLTFVDHVAWMGLEITGFTRANLRDLWVDPYDYQRQLRDAVLVLSTFGLNTSIYNLQLCTLPAELWHFARHSISDWKNEFMPECNGCTKRSECGGFFSSARLRYSDHIVPF